MWDKIPEYKDTIRFGLKLRKTQFHFECVILVGYIIAGLITGFSDSLLLVCLIPSGMMFVAGLTILKTAGYFKACKFFGLSGHEPKSIIEARLNGQPISKFAKALWMIDDR